MLKAKNVRVAVADLELYLMDDPYTSQQTNYTMATGSALLTQENTSVIHEITEVSKGQGQ